MKKYLVTTVVVATLIAGQAAADAINYSYFELGYLETDLEVSNFDVDGDGFELNVSTDVSETVAVVFGYQDVEFDLDVEARLMSLGIAYHKPYSNTGDMVLGLAYLDREIDLPVVPSLDDTGNEISLEIRSRTSGQTEIHHGLLRREIDDESDSGYQFRIVTGNPQGFQFVIDYEDLDETSGLMLGLRSSF